MRALLALAVTAGGLFLAMSLSLREAGPAGNVAIQPAIDDVIVVDYLRTERVEGPKAPPQPVHVLADNPARLFVRTRGVERVDVAVQISGSDGFGVFSGYPDDNGFVSIDVTVPEAGSSQSVREPGPEGKRATWEVPPGTVYYLVPTGILPGGSVGYSYGPKNEPAITGEPVWVRLDE